jgi:hypothetical protein
LVAGSRPVPALALETAVIGSVVHGARQDLDGDVAFETMLVCPIHDTEAAAPDLDLVGIPRDPEARSRIIVGHDRRRSPGVLNLPATVPQ